MFINFALWLVQKTHAISSANQMQNESNSDLITHIYMHRKQFVVSTLSSHRLMIM